MEQKKPSVHVNKVVNFFNWTKKDFEHTFSGEMLFFPKGEVTPIVVGDYKTNIGVRDLMAYHLAIRECNAEDYTPASRQDTKLQSMIAKALSEPTQERIYPPARPLQANPQVNPGDVNTGQNTPSEDGFEQP